MMVYRKLNLISFGKFKKKQLTLNEGINLIIGDNESGKSTIQRFVEGIFYGFFSYGKKRRGFEEFQQRYKPWMSEEYIGSLMYEHESKAYLVERNFSERQGYVKVFKHNTGEDITNAFDFNDVAKVPEPSKHLGVSKIMFRNAVNIGQLDTPDETMLAEEVGTLMANMDSGFADISTTKAVKTLRDAAEKIAGKKGEVRQVGQINSDLERLVAEKEHTEELLRNDKQRQGRMIELNDKLNRLKHAELFERIRQLQKYEKIEEEIDACRQEAEQIKAGQQSAVNEEVFEQVLNLDAQARSAVENAKNRKNALDALNEEMEALKQQESAEALEYPIEEIRQDYNLFNQLRGGGYTKSITLFDLTPFILLLLSIGFGVFSLVNKMFPMTIICGVLALGSIVWIILKLLNRRKLSTQDICMKYGFADEAEFDVYYKTSVAEYERVEQNNALLEAKMQEYVRIRDEITELKRQYDELNEQLQQLLQQSGMREAGEYREALKQNKRYNELITKIEYSQKLKDEMLSEAEYTALKGRLGDVSRFNLAQNDYDEHMRAQNKEEILSELSRLKGKQDEALKNASSMTEIEARIKELTLRRDALLLDYAALNLAADTMEEAAREMHEKNSPMLNEKISATMYYITSKYNDIRLTDNMKISVYTPDEGLLVPLESLSVGTIEQIYFSLRLALADMFAPGLPLMFDDSFITYDESRLENIIRILYNVSSDRQVILFSCTQREKEILDEMDIDYNLINL